HGGTVVGNYNTYTINREWTEKERMKMKESILLTEVSKEAKWYKDKESILLERNTLLMEKDKLIQEKEKLLIKNTETLQMKEKMLEEREKLLQETKCKLEQMVKETQIQKTELTRQQKEIEEKELQLKYTAQQNSDLHTETETLRSVISSQLTVSLTPTKLHSSAESLSPPLSEEIRQTYEGEARMEADRNLMKILLPELQQRLLVLMSKMQEKFSRQMEEKDRELKTLAQEAARYGDSIHLKEYTESVTGYISKCIDDVTISKVIATHPNQKPWMTTEVRVLLGTRDKAFKSGDKASLRTARAKLSWAIREAKRTYAQKIHSHFQNTADMHRMWQCIQAVTNYKTPSPTCDSDASLPNVLNSFYARFEAQNCTTARKTTPLPTKQALCLSTADVRKSLLRVKPLSQIAVLAECTENVLTN
ncbi:hypothetical protein NFI96_008482, partial [Prochilodus magdalenae]